MKDYLVQITGRTKDDPIVNAILGTFNAVKSFITEEVSENALSAKDQEKPEDNDRSGGENIQSKLGLSYHINIVLPETKDVTVFNAIFQSLKQNLLS